jgi:sulfide:quinone oxidoreductase
VYAAGDGTTLPIKQGGLASQLADVVCRHIAAGIVGEDDPEPFRPVLRGLLLTPDGPLYLRAELDDPDGTSTISEQPLWWPPSKIASRWLSPYLARIESARRRGESGSTAPTPGG